LAGTKSNEEMGDAVKKQAEISILMFAPIVVAFIIFIKPVIIALYSEKFLPIEEMLYWAMGATLIKATGWALSYTLLAKAQPAYFFYNELFAKFYTLPLTILGYKYFGLTGFGIALLIGYSIYLIQEMIVVKKMFGVYYNYSFWKLLLILHIPILVSYLAKNSYSVVLVYLLGSLVLCVTFIYVFYELNKRMDLVSIIRKK